MARRWVPDADLAALREDAGDLMEVVAWAARLGASDDGWSGRTRLVELADRLGVEAPPPMAVLVERPAALDEWGVRVGLSRWG